MSKVSAQLTTPNNMAYLWVIQGFVEQVAAMAGLMFEDARRLTLAVEEAFSNALRYGFEAGDQGEVTVRFEALACEARVTLGYTGLPFDPQEIPDHGPDPANGFPDKGLGTALMRSMCDSFEMRNLGRGRQETVLVKRFASPVVQEEAGVAADPSPDLPLPAYAIRPMRPEEAAQVSRLAFIAYGDSYAHDALYFPDQVRAMNAEGTMRSWVAATPGDEVAAHGALMRKTPDSLSAELAGGFTKPGHRSRGCMDSLTPALLAFADELGLRTLFLTAVTRHSYSQASARKHGFRECALLVAEVTPLRFRAIADCEGQRETFMLMQKSLRGPKSLTLYPPQAHAAMVERIGDWLGLAIEAGGGAPALPGAECPTVMHVEVNLSYNAATIAVQGYGPDFADALRAQLRSLLARGVRAVRLSLPLGDPATAALAPTAEELGFFFCGVSLVDSEGVSLLLQHLGSMVYDYSLIQTASDQGRELVAYVQAADPMGQL